MWGASQAFGASLPPSLCDGAPLHLVSNCGFETGDFQDWTLGGNTANPGGNYYGVDSFDANSGNYGAYMSQDYIDGGTAPVDLSQTITTTPGVLYDITFWLEQDTAPTLGYTHAFSAAWGGTTILSLTPTVAVPGPVGSFTEYSFAETAPAASTTLTFAFENDDNYWSFDDVAVVPAATPATPEPSTGLLAGVVMSVLLLLWRRSSSIAGTV
jgi:hypothetical protein